MTTRQLLLRSKWIAGWMSWEELSFLAETASDLKDNSIIYEIGSFCGRSAKAIADNAPENCKIYCIDPWDFVIPAHNEIIVIDESAFEQFCINLNDHIKSKKVIPIVSKWEDFTPPAKADFIFIDGNHTYDAVRHDISKALMYIKSDGIIAGHDYTSFDGVYRSVNEFFSDIHVKDTIWWTKKF
jgi:predicted O-methyltransferase YrrM